MIEALTLDQLRLLVAIADTGSFTAAAKAVQRAQSAVSHGIKQLEAEIGVPLFDRSTRKPTLTEEGSAVLAEARTVLARIDRLKAQARAMQAGVEQRLTVALSVLVPRRPLLQALARIEAAYPQVMLRLTVDEVGVAPGRVLRKEADIAIAGRLSLAGQGAALEVHEIGAVDIIAVCAPGHPLAAMQGPVPEAALEDHRQLTTVTTALGRYPNQLAQATWEAADLGMRRDMLLAGLGWGTIPSHAVEADIAAGRLVELALGPRPGDVMAVPMFLAHRRDTPLGPVGRMLLDAMGDEAG
ncbi:MAG: LysR family transcriptional regulator [Pseudomonadota bacterium]